MLVVKVLVKLPNLHIHPVAIQSELKYVIAAKPEGTVKLEQQSSSNLAKHLLVHIWIRVTAWG
jgi:hypothetical protein